MKQKLNAAANTTNPQPRDKRGVGLGDRTGDGSVGHQRPELLLIRPYRARPVHLKVLRDRNPPDPEKDVPCCEQAEADEGIAGFDAGDETLPLHRVCPRHERGLAPQPGSRA